jgi:predicted ATPase
MLRELGALPENELQGLLSEYPYHRQVFLFPPWEAIYVNDSERDQTFVEAVRVCWKASEWYQRCGYGVVEVPKVGVAERCVYVLQALGAGAGRSRLALPPMSFLLLRCRADAPDGAVRCPVD